MAVQETSVFERKSLSDIHKEIRQVYTSNDYPWIIGYSGGKDSTTAAQLVWNTLAEMKPTELTKEVYIIASDTLVENPRIAAFIDDTLHRMNNEARKQGLPIKARKVTPQVEDTFWVNLIGKGYPAPYNRFRWCTDRLKIKPANRFILDTVSNYGEVVVILGVRRGESATRDQVLTMRSVQGGRLKTHTNLPRAYVFAPIEEFTVDDVWNYLLQVKSPWGNDNRDLAALYRSAQAGECPLVIDDTTPSCGNSRFGCWTCTVVAQDSTMESLIDDGEEWMQPLLEYRDKMLAATQDPKVKHEYRDYKHRNGQVYFKRDGTVSYGPYTLEYRRDLLKELLRTQEAVRAQGPYPSLQLITEPELREIRRIWRQEGDWSDALPDIYQEVTGESLQWLRDEYGTFSSTEKSLLSEICESEGVPDELVLRLLDIERRLQGMKRRATVFTELEDALNEVWRTKDEVEEVYRQLQLRVGGMQ